MLQPEVLVFVLLIPLIVYFILPGLILMAGRITASGGLQAAMGKTIAGRKYSSAVEQREWPRQRFEGVIAHVSDGEHCSRVAVKNISEHGICFTCPREDLTPDRDRLAVLLTGSGANYQLQVRPQWKKGQGMEQSIGALIVDSLGGWSDFARRASGSRSMRAA